MKIDNARPAGTGRVVATGPARAAARAYGAQAAASAGPAAPLDLASIAGIPETELTPKVRDALAMLIAEVQRMREDLAQAQQRVSYLEKLADEDSLVPVANRRAFVRELGRLVAFAERYGTRSSVLYFDINGFKRVNDEFGHAAGDAALHHIAQILTANVRESDVVGRLGGDEFGVILAQADADVAAEKAASLARAIETQPLNWEGNALRLTASFGAYAFSGDVNAGEALERADQAMYAQRQVKRPAANG
jgi:diguanylate cyclase (GGDEF)-like protein